MNLSPLISIITPVYNHEKFIRDTIESVINQTYQNWEMLVVDDCSVDRSWEIIQEYAKKDNRIKAFRNETNKGLVLNWEFLINKSSGDYIAFLEGDDVFNKKNLEEKIKIFEKYQGVGMVYCNFEVINEKNNIIINNFYKKLKVKTYNNQKISPGEYLYSNYLFSTYSQIMIKRSVLTISGYPRSFDLNEKVFLPSDWDFNFRVSTKNKVYFVDDILLRYRKHSNNSSSNTLRVSNQLRIVLDDYRKEFMDNRRVLGAIKYMEGKSYYYNIIYYIENGMKKEALKNIFCYIKSYPKNIIHNFMLNIIMLIRFFLPNKLGLYLKSIYFRK